MRDVATTTITIEPTTGTGLFAARLGDRLLVEHSAEPLLAAARVLLAERWNPDALLVMRHRGAGHDALRAKLKVAARLTVEDGRDGVPRFRRWKAPPSVGPTPPMRVGEAVKVAP